jgi:microcin C transport system permease protein
MANFPQIRLSPLTRKRLIQFRHNRRAWTSFVLLAALFVLSLCAPLLCNSRPLLLRHEGKISLPFLHTGDVQPMDYRALAHSINFTSRAGNFAFFAPVPFGPNEVLDPAAFEIHRRATLVLTPENAAGRFNITADGRITRAENCDSFFPGVVTINSEKLADHWIVPAALTNALGTRFANQPAPAVEITLTHSSNASLRAVAALVAFESRETPPTSIRVALRQTTSTASITFRVSSPKSGDTNAATCIVTPAQTWQTLPADTRSALQACITRAFAAGSESKTNVVVSGAAMQAQCTLSDVTWPHRPVPGHWMGVDAAGRDVLARVVFGMRTSLAFGLLLVGWAMLLGFVIGAAQGYFGGWLDITGQRLIEIWSALPFLYVMILIGSVLGRSFLLLLVCYGLFNWISLSYYLRAEFLRLRHRPFVEAARCQGLGHARIIVRHLLPNALTPLITLFPFELVGAIATLTALDFLGFGLPPLTPSWGELLQQAQQCRWAWWLALYPTAALFAVMLLTVFIGEGLRDAFDPKPRTKLEG